MAFDCQQFRKVIADTLQIYPELYSASAVNLLLGTAAVESAFGTYLRQLGGPALGVFQMEPATFLDIQERRGYKYPLILNHKPIKLVTDLELAIIMARLKYRDDPAPLPDAGDVQGFALYWKFAYNSIIGSGTAKKFIQSYNRYVGGCHVG